MAVTDIRFLSFSEGTSVSAPEISLPAIYGIQVFTNDAAFVSDKGEAAQEGDIYFNSSLKTLRFYDGISWNDLSVKTNNYTATVDPTVNDDTDLGYARGSIWYNTNTEVFFICTDSTDGAAVWTALVTQDATQELTNKKLTGGTASADNLWTVPSNTKSNLDGLGRTAAAIYYDSTNSKYWGDNGADLVDLGAGGGGVTTYFSDDFEINIDNASTSDAVNFAISQETTNPLFGDASLRISKAASDQSGDYVRIGSFSTKADTPVQIMTVQFNYKTSADYADDDIYVYVYDGTNRLTVPPETLKAGSGAFTGTFQTSSGAGTYSLELYQNSTSALDYAVDIDNVQISSFPIVNGSVVTEWQQFDMDGTWTTNTDYEGLWRRVGDSLEVVGSVSTSGVPGVGTVLYVNLPSGLDIDTTKLGYTTVSNYEVLGEVNIREDGVDSYAGAVRYNSTTDVRLAYYNDAGSLESLGNLTSSTPMTWGAGDFVVFSYKVPIAGWSAQSQLGVDAGTRDVAFSAILTSNISVDDNTTTKIIWDSVEKDSTASFNAGTGDFEIPETGWYTINAGIAYESATWAANAQSQLYVLVDGGGANRGLIAYEDILASTHANYNNSLNGGADFYFEKGDNVAIWVRHTQGTTLNVLGQTGFPRYVSIKKSSSSNQIFAGEKIRVEASSAGQAVTSGGDDFVAADVIEDTHGAYDETTGEFEAPKSGAVRVSIGLLTAAVTMSATQYFTANLLKDEGAGYSTVSLMGNPHGTGSSTNLEIFSSTSVKVNRGDKLKILLTSNVNTNLNSVSTHNRIVFEMD